MVKAVYGINRYEGDRNTSLHGMVQAESVTLGQVVPIVTTVL